MAIILRGFIYLIIILFIFSPILGQTPGQEWLDSSKTTREAFIFGFQQGTNIAIWNITLSLSREIEDMHEINQAQITQKQASILNAALAKIRKEAGGQFGVEPVADMITALYNDPANTFIKWPIMIHIAVMKLSGISQNEINKTLETARKASAPERERLFQ